MGTRLVRISLLGFFVAATSQGANRVNEDCDNEIHLGMSSTGGNRSAVGGSAGAKGCADNEKRRWALEGDVTVIRISSDSGTSTVERHEIEADHESQLSKRWSAVLEVSQEGDGGGGLESRWVVSPGLGTKFHPKWGFVSLEAGIANTWENNRGEPRKSIPEAWVEADLQWKIRPNAKFREKLELNASTEDQTDYRFDAESTLSVKVGEHISLRVAFELRWNRTPPRGYEKVDWNMRTLFGYSWGSKKIQ